MQQIASGKERNYLFDNMKVLLTFFMVKESRDQIN